MNRELFLLALPLSLAIACGTGDEFEPCSSGQCDEGETNYEVILGAETPWVKCWVELDPDENEDDFFRRDEVICELTPNELPLNVRFAIVHLKTADDRHSEVRLTKDEPRAAVKALNVAAYPASIEASMWIEKTSTNIYNGMTTYYTKEFSIERGSTPSIEEPYLVSQPWDYWPVEIEAKIKSARLTAEYELDLSGVGMTVNEGQDTSIEARIGTRPVKAGNSKMFYVPVASVGVPTAVSGVGQFRDDSGYRELDYTIDGPGRYIADAEGLHRVEEEGMN